PTPLGDDGKTIVKLVSGGTNATDIFTTGNGHVLNGIDFVNTPQIVDLADIRRDVPNTAEMNRTMNVTVKDDTAALRIYNDSLIDNGEPALLIMPVSWYTLNIPLTGGSGGVYNITMQPGELAKQISITLANATLMDPSSTYGFAFTITSADANGIISTNKTLVYELGAKNKYDGVYKGKGYTFMGATNTTAPYLWSIDCDWGLNLITTGANTVYMDAKPVFRGGSIIYFGGIFPTLVFDQATDNITAVANTAPGNGYNYVLPAAQTPGYHSRYDEATKTIYVSYNLINTTWYATDTLVYCGPR
ncbi:MAG: DUF1735 domain-containing protein, partial [Sphingobacteriaceae bacterium]